MVVALLTGPGHSALDPAGMPGSDTGDLVKERGHFHTIIHNNSNFNRNIHQAYHFSNHDNHG